MDNLVSILIPAYNAEKWIAETIRSALNQTWPKTEIIIVDDGSSDNTLHVAREFESKSLKVITQKNRGASAARNTALGYAQGDYIQWLDADDLLASDKISQQLKLGYGSRNSKILMSSSFGTFFYRYQKAEFLPHALWQDLAPVEWLIIKLRDNVWMNPAVWLVSRRLTELAGPWDERLSLDDDGEYFSRLVASSERVKFIPTSRSFYRRSNIGSLSRTTSDKACRSLFLSLNLCIGYLLSLENSERTRNACLVYLQTWFHYFYPDKLDLLDKMNALAKDLGGTLSPPELSWKYSLIKNLFGWKATKLTTNFVRKTKSSTHANWDKFIYKLSNH